MRYTALLGWVLSAAVATSACQDPPPPPTPVGHVPGANARTAALTAEARRRGLDKGDLIIDRRLVQKLEWALALEVEVPEPTEEELAAFHAQHAQRYQTPATTTFTQIFFDRARRPAADSEARKGLELALAGTPPTGDAWTRGHTKGASRKQIEGAFGNQFAAVVTGAKENVWLGPITSPYGHHLVRVTEQRKAGVPAFEEIRGRVREDWRSERKRVEVQRRLDEIGGETP